MKKWASTSNYLILKWLPIGLRMKMWLWPSQDSGLQVSLQPTCPISSHLILPFTYWYLAPLMTFYAHAFFCPESLCAEPLLYSCALFSGKMFAQHCLCEAPHSPGLSLHATPSQRSSLITSACLKWPSSVPLQFIPSHNVLLGPAIVRSYIAHLTILLLIVHIFHRSLLRPWK